MRLLQRKETGEVRLVKAVMRTQVSLLLVALLCLVGVRSYAQLPEGATKIEFGDAIYEITVGGNYVLPDTMKSQVRVSGGTADNPVNLFLSDTVVCESKGGSICQVDGYLNIIGVGSSPVAWMDHPHNFVLNSKEAVTVHFTMTNLTIDYHGEGEKNPVYMCTEPPGRSYVYINHCTIKNWVRTSTEGYSTGAIVLMCSDAEISDCTISNCTSDRAGAIGLLGWSNVRVARCELTDNKAIQSAGAIFVTTDTLTSGLTQPNYLIIEDCQISGNESREAAIVVDDGLGERVVLAGGTIVSGNTALVDGRQSNIFLADGAFLYLDASWGGSAGVWTETEPTSEQPVKVAEALSPVAAAGISTDSTDDVAELDGGVLWFTKAAPVVPAEPAAPSGTGSYWICTE